MVFKFPEVGLYITGSDIASQLVRRNQKLEDHEPKKGKAFSELHYIAHKPIVCNESRGPSSVTMILADHENHHKSPYPSTLLPFVSP